MLINFSSVNENTIIKLPISIAILLALLVPLSMALVELKVGVHCEKCQKAIKKAIKKIEDLDTYKVDAELNKVTVTGNTTTEEVIKVLQKIGKSATPWSED